MTPLAMILSVMSSAVAEGRADWGEIVLPMRQLGFTDDQLLAAVEDEGYAYNGILDYLERE